jgi:hypothetical protein
VLDCNSEILTLRIIDLDKSREFRHWFLDGDFVVVKNEILEKALFVCHKIIM